MEDNSSKIDTQGMSGPAKAGYDPKKDKTVYKPAVVRPRRLFTETYAKEMKILINEVLDEREGKTGISYFDTENFKYHVGEEEPPYKPNDSKSIKEIVLESLREWVKETEYLTQPTDPKGRYYCSKSNCEGVRFPDERDEEPEAWMYRGTY